MPSNEGHSDAGDTSKSAGPSPATTRYARAAFLRLAVGFWTGTSSRRASTLTMLLVLFVAMQLSAQIGSNLWSRFFFDSLEARNATALYDAVILLVLLVAYSGIANSGSFVARMNMQVAWRVWLSEKLVGWWLKDQRYYRVEISAEDMGSLEYRIAKDVQLAIEPLVDFAIGLVTAIVTAVTFIGILWGVGGPLSITLFGWSFTVPGYIAVASVLYMAAATSITAACGRSLIGAVADKNEREAQFLAELMRIRENAESIALIRGDANELESMRANLARLAAAWRSQIWRNGVVGTVQSANSVLVPLFPLVLAAPKYFADTLSLGAIMQLASAFVAVQGALNWFVDNFVRIAEWSASAQRIQELIDTLESIDVAAIMTNGASIELAEAQDDDLHLEELAVAHRGGQIVIAPANVLIAAGEKVLVVGASGTGKSTLIRALAGLWPWGSGRILMPVGARIAFVSQKPYVPQGTLRSVLMYSVVRPNLTDDMIEGAMRRCGLAYLISKLDDDRRWDQLLSGGERQRIAFARLLLERPDIIIMDEATSALDEESQIALLGLFLADLDYATVISVGHRAGMEDFHDKKLLLERRPAGARLSSSALEKPLWHLLTERLRT